MKSLQAIQGIDIYLLDQFLKGRLGKDMKVLDAGCGYGRNIRWLLQQGYDVTGMDANAEAIELLKSEYPEQAARFFTGRLEALPSETQFDFVVCNAVLHFAEGHAMFEAMFGGLLRALAPGGTLFIRMTSDIGLEGRLGSGNAGVFELPDGSTRYLLTRPMVNDLIAQHGLDLLEHVKTVFVDGLRSMTTLVLQKTG